MANKGVVSILITARDQASRVLAATAKQVKDFGAKAKSASFDLNSLTSRIGELAALGGVALALKDAARAADDFAASQKALAGAAKLTGAPLDFVQELARKGRENFSLGAAEANSFATELTQLAAKTGNLGQAQGALNDFLNLGAAQGLKTAETLDLLRRAADGDEKAIKKFVNLKPDQVFEAFASKIGKTAEQLTDAERTQALFNIAAEKGALVQGEYGKFLESTQGKLNDTADKIEDFKAKLGELLAPLREAGALLGSTIVDGLNAFLGGLQLLAVDAALLLPKIGAQFDLLAAKIVGIFSPERGAEMEKNARALIADLNRIAEEEAAKIVGVGGKNGFDQKALSAAEAKLKADIKSSEEAKKKAEAAKNAQATLDAELQLIDAKIKANKEDEDDKKRLAEIEDDINKKLQQKNLTLAEQLKLEQALLNIASIRQSITDKNVGENLNGSRGNRVAGGDGGLGNLGQDNGAGLDENGNRAATGILAGGRPEGIPAAAKEKARTLGEELSAVFQEAAAGPMQEFFQKGIEGFDNLGDAVKAFGKSVAQSLANIAAQLATNFLLRKIFGSAFSGGQGGSIIPGFAGGGLVTGPGGPRDDKILAALSNGEGVLTAKAVAAIGGKAGLDFLNSLSGPRALRVPRFADGGIAGAAAEGGRLDGSITVGLGDGLVVSELETPAGQRGLLKVLSKNKQALRGITGG